MEILVVIAILGVLMIIGAGVASRMIGQGDVKKTTAIQKIIHEAVERYRDDKGSLPPAGEMDKLYEELKDHRPCRQILTKLPKGAMTTDGFYDSYGIPMRYEPTGGLGGTAVLISAGPDGQFDEEDDNIRSDEN